mmetsp:Transcript_27207/g.33026  ORF Transcript_27207/g.33026 Transcript_27207/m.33026 type:complete len:222 (+) Transcript_27207:168-833(+)
MILPTNLEGNYCTSTRTPPWPSTNYFSCYSHLFISKPSMRSFPSIALPSIALQSTVHHSFTPTHLSKDLSHFVQPLPRAQRHVQDDCATSKLNLNLITRCPSLIQPSHFCCVTRLPALCQSQKQEATKLAAKASPAQKPQLTAHDELLMRSPPTNKSTRQKHTLLPRKEKKNVGVGSLASALISIREIKDFKRLLQQYSCRIYHRRLCALIIYTQPALFWK